MSEQSKKRTVLVVEDEHQTRTLLALMLEQGGHNVLEAAHPNEAANVWRRESHNIDIIVADIWLPGISGPELAAFFRRERADLKSIFVTGMGADIRPEFRKLTRNSHIITKPFTKQQLLEAMARAFGAE